MRRRYRMALIGGPNCGTAILDDVATWPPPVILTVKGYGGWYARTWVDENKNDDFYPDSACSTATYEWHTA